jgi:hypothetical protein
MSKTKEIQKDKNLQPKLRNIDLYRLLGALNRMGNQVGADFNQFRLQNLMILRDQCKILDQACPELETINRELEIVYQKYAMKDISGNFLSQDNGFGQPKYIFKPTDIVKVNKEVEKINLKYKKPLDERSAFLQKETNVTLYKIHSQDMAKNLNGNDWDDLRELIIFNK